MLLNFADLDRATAAAWCGNCREVRGIRRTDVYQTLSWRAECAMCECWTKLITRHDRIYWDFRVNVVARDRPANYPPPRWTRCC